LSLIAVKGIDYHFQLFNAVNGITLMTKPYAECLVHLGSFVVGVSRRNDHVPAALTVTSKFAAGVGPVGDEAPASCMRT
jgi:hypothetical protein